MTRIHLKPVLILLGLSYIFFMLGNSFLSLTIPDEVFYAQTAKEMVQHKTWMTPFLFGAPQFEKPIFIYWLLRLGFLFFGVSSFSARLFPAFFATLGVIAVYLLGLIGFKNQKKAFISALVLASGGLYIGLARTVFTDMVFSVFILFSLAAFYWAYVRPERKALGILLFFVFSALAVLSKGPLGFIIPFLVIVVFLAVRKELFFLFCKATFWGLLIFAALSLPWYILMIQKYGSSFIQEFFYNDHIRRLIEAEHISNDTWYFYPASMIGVVYPWSLYTLLGLFFLVRHLKRGPEPMNLFLAIWIGVTFLIFQPAHSKLISYIFPFFPALALVTGEFICNTISQKKGLRALIIISLITLFSILVMAAGLFFNMERAAVYLPSKTPIYILLSLLLLFALVFAWLLARKKYMQMVIFLSFLLPMVIALTPLVSKDIEPYASSKTVSEYLLNNYKVEGPILCSKFFARGVRYYTDMEVAVIDTPAINFFSPHPIPFLNTEEKIFNYLKAHPNLYCILKKGSVEKIHLVGDGHFKITQLKQIANVYLMKVEPLDRAKAR